MKTRTVFYPVVLVILGLSLVQAQQIPKNVKPFVRLVTEAVYVAEYRGGELVRSYLTKEGSSGSGTVISRDGLILTNYHVAKPSGRIRNGESTIVYYAASNSLNVYELSNNDPKSKPQLRYIADYLGGDEDLDMAILKIVADANTGQAIDNQEFDYVPFGNPFDIPMNQELTLLGYPGKGGVILNITSGPYNGSFVSDEAGDSRNGRIKTVAPIAQGNSGGSALFQQRLIGVPSAVSLPDEAGAAFSYLNPVTWAIAPLIVVRVKHELNVPEIDPRWVESEYNYKESTKNNIYLAGKVRGAQSRQPLENALVLVFRGDRSFKEITTLIEEVKTISQVAKIQKAVKSGTDIDDLADSLNVDEEVIERLMKVTLANFSEDVQRMIQGEFFYQLSTTDDSGFFMQNVPRGMRMVLYIEQKGYRSLNRDYVPGAGLYDNFGIINLVQY